MDDIRVRINLDPLNDGIVTEEEDRSRYGMILATNGEMKYLNKNELLQSLLTLGQHRYMMNLSCYRILLNRNRIFDCDGHVCFAGSMVVVRTIEHRVQELGHRDLLSVLDLLEERMDICQLGRTAFDVLLVGEGA